MDCGRWGVNREIREIRERTDPASLRNFLLRELRRTGRRDKWALLGIFLAYYPRKSSYPEDEGKDYGKDKGNRAYVLIFTLIFALISIRSGDIRMHPEGERSEERFIDKDSLWRAFEQFNCRL